MQNSQENTCPRETLTQVFSCEFCKISKNNFLSNASRRLLLIGGLTCWFWCVKFAGWEAAVRMFLKIGVFKNFSIFTGKQLCWSVFLIKLQAWRPETLLTRDSNTGSFLWILLNVYEQLFYRTPPVAAFTG